MKLMVNLLIAKSDKHGSSKENFYFEPVLK